MTKQRQLTKKLLSKLIFMYHFSLLKHVDKKIKSIPYPVKFQKIKIKSEKDKLLLLTFMYKSLILLKRLLPNMLKYAIIHKLHIKEFYILTSKKIIIIYKN